MKKRMASRRSIGRRRIRTIKIPGLKIVLPAGVSPSTLDGAAEFGKAQSEERARQKEATAVEKHMANLVRQKQIAEARAEGRAAAKEATRAKKKAAKQSASSTSNLAVFQSQLYDVLKGTEGFRLEIGSTEYTLKASSSKGKVLLFRKKGYVACGEAVSDLKEYARVIKVAAEHLQ